MSVESTIDGIKADLSKILSKNSNNHNELSPEDVERCQDMFQELDDCNITLEILTNTLVGTIVMKFKRYSEVGEIAKSLIKKWKQIAKEGGVNIDGREESVHPHQPPRTNTILEHLEEALKNNIIPHTKHTDLKGITEGLDKLGVALVPLPADSFDWKSLKCKSGQLLKETFPNLTTNTKRKLQEGDLNCFNEEWKSGKVEDHNIMLYSAGMPCPITLSSEVVRQHQDPTSGLIFRYNPLAAKCPSLVWSFLPHGLFPDGAFVASDGMKTIAGGKQTPIHYDGDATLLNDKKNKYSRVQCLLIGDDPNAKRHLHFVANTPLIHSLLSRTTKTDPGKLKERGFRSLNLNKNPKIEELLLQYSNTVRPGLVLMRSGTFHMEKINDINNTKNNKAAFCDNKTLRYYCGYIPYAKEQEGVTIPTLIRIAFLRCHGYAMDSYSLQVNRQSILFTNDKTTQFRQVQLTNPDEDLLKLYETSHTDMCQYLTNNLSQDELAMYALNFEDLLLEEPSET